MRGILLVLVFSNRYYVIVRRLLANIIQINNMAKTDDLMEPLNCPICDQASYFAYTHPETSIYRCTACTHAFSNLESIETFEVYGEDYYIDTHRKWFENPNIALFKWISSRIPENARSVLDVGCGKGDFLRYLHQVRPDLSLTGVDLSSNSDTEGIHYIQADIHEVDLDMRFDVVVNLAVIEHVMSVKDFTRALVDLSNPNGKVFIMTLNESGLLYRIACAGKKLGLGIAFDRLYSVHHLHHFSAQSLSTLMQQSGLSVDNVHLHNAPLKSVDFPTENKLISALFTGVLIGIFVLGRLFYGGYLQTIEATRLDNDD